jgi:hypothetical protein
MVKRIQKTVEREPEEHDNVSEEEVEEENQEIDDLSDLEMVDPEAIVEENKQNAINDPEALEKLAEKLQTNMNNYLKQKGLKTGNWLEYLTTTAKEGIDENLNVEDDIRRELVL